MSGPGFDQESSPDRTAASEDSLARAAAAGPPITDDEDSDATYGEAAEAHDTPAAGDEDRAAEDTSTDGTEHPELSSIYGPPGSRDLEEDRG